MFLYVRNPAQKGTTITVEKYSKWNKCRLKIARKGTKLR